MISLPYTYSNNCLQEHLKVVVIGIKLHLLDFPVCLHTNLISNIQNGKHVFASLWHTDIFCVSN